MENPNGVPASPPMDRTPSNITRRSALGAAAVTAFGANAVMAQRVGSIPARPSVSIADRGFSITDFGARTDASGGANFDAFKRCLAQCAEEGVSLQIPAGRFELLIPRKGETVLDPTCLRRGARRAISITGTAGPASSVLSLGDGRGLHFATTTDWHDLELGGFSIVGAVDGPLLTIGRDDFADPLNMLHIHDLYIENSLEKPEAVALRLNYIAPGGYAIGLKCNAYSALGKTNCGTAVEFRQVECMTLIGGAIGNAAVGVKIDGGVSFGLVFSGITFENCNVSIQHLSPLSGGHLFQGCQFSNIVNWAIQSAASLTSEWIEFNTCNFALPGDLVDPCNHEGVRICDRRNIATPPIPPSGEPITNATGRHLDIYLWGGEINRITLNGSLMHIPARAVPAMVIVRLAPGQVIKVDWVAMPSWAWHNGG